MSKLRIAFWGNQDNFSYRVSKWLRAKGHSVDLYLMRKGESVRSSPELIDRDLEGGNYPDWIKTYNNKYSQLLISDKKIIDQFEKRYDIILISGSMGMLFAPKFTIPTICFSMGPSQQGVIRMWDNLGLKYRILWSAIYFFIRKTLARCQKVLICGEYEIYSLWKLNQIGKVIIYGIPEDVKGNQERVDKKLLEELNKEYGKYQCVLLWLSRIDMSNDSSPMYKGTEIFLEAASKLINEGANIRIVVGKHGADLDKFRHEAIRLGVDSYIDWVEHLPYYKLLTYLSISNAIIFDEIKDVAFTSSGMTRESLSVGGIVFRKNNDYMTRKGYSSTAFPVYDCVNADEICAHISDILSWDKERFLSEKLKRLSWAEKNLDWTVQIDNLVNILDEIVAVNKSALKINLKINSK